mgnify:CR=1 FL=1
MKALQLAIPLFVLLGGLTVSTTLSYGKVEYTKQEKKACTVCHVSAKSKELNAVGKCYGEKQTLEGCEAKK